MYNTQQVDIRDWHLLKSTRQTSNLKRARKASRKEALTNRLSFFMPGSTNPIALQILQILFLLSVLSVYILVCFMLIYQQATPTLRLVSGNSFLMVIQRFLVNISNSRRFTVIMVVSIVLFFFLNSSLIAVLSAISQFLIILSRIVMQSVSSAPFNTRLVVFSLNESIYVHSGVKTLSLLSSFTPCFLALLMIMYPLSFIMRLLLTSDSLGYLPALHTLWFCVDVVKSSLALLL